MVGLELELGCGKKKHPNAIGVDMNPGLKGIVDVVFEMKGRIGLPFIDNSFSRVYMIDFVEHVDDIPWLLSEVYRVSEPNAEVIIRYPHYSCIGAYSDVTHLHELSLRAFDHFDPSTEYGKNYQYYTLFGRNFPYEIVRLEPAFHPIIAILSRLICKTIGTYNYEKVIATLLPIATVNLELRVIKE